VVLSSESLNLYLGVPRFLWFVLSIYLRTTFEQSQISRFSHFVNTKLVIFPGKMTDPNSTQIPKTYNSLGFTEIKVSHHPASAPQPTPVIIVTLYRPKAHNAFTFVMQQELQKYIHSPKRYSSSSGFEVDLIYDIGFSSYWI
jgi:hypothetical protein